MSECPDERGRRLFTLDMDLPAVTSHVLDQITIGACRYCGDDTDVTARKLQPVDLPIPDDVRRSE